MVNYQEGLDIIEALYDRITESGNDPKVSRQCHVELFEYVLSLPYPDKSGGNDYLPKHESMALWKAQFVEECRMVNDMFDSSEEDMISKLLRIPSEYSDSVFAVLLMLRWIKFYEVQFDFEMFKEVGFETFYDRYGEVALN